MVPINIPDGCVLEVHDPYDDTWRKGAALNMAADIKARYGEDAEEYISRSFSLRAILYGMRYTWRLKCTSSEESGG